MPNSTWKSSRNSNEGFIADDWKLHHDNAPAHTLFLVTCWFKGANNSSTALQSWRGSPRLLFVSVPENSHERTSFRDSWQSQRGLNQRSKGHSGEGLLWHLRCLEISLEAMYRHRRSLFWNLIMCCTDLFKKFFFIDPLTLLLGKNHVRY